MQFIRSVFGIILLPSLTIFLDLAHEGTLAKLAKALLIDILLLLPLRRFQRWRRQISLIFLNLFQVLFSLLLDLLLHGLCLFLDLVIMLFLATLNLCFEYQDLVYGVRKLFLQIFIIGIQREKSIWEVDFERKLMPVGSSVDLVIRNAWVNCWLLNQLVFWVGHRDDILRNTLNISKQYTKFWVLLAFF